MAEKTNCTINGRNYYRLTKTIGKKLNKNGIPVPVRKTFYGRNRKDAEAKYQAYLEKKKQGIDDRRQYFGIVADNWIYEFFAHDASLSDGTKERYIGAWNKYIRPLDLYHLPLEEVTASAIQKAYNSMDCPPSALLAAHKLMRKFYKYLEREGFSRDVTVSVVPPKGRRQIAQEITIWTEEELNTIFNNFDKAQKGFRIAFLLILLYHTGCRISEALALTYDDFTPAGLIIDKQVISDRQISREGIGRTLTIGELKTQSSYRTIPLNAVVLSELEKHKAWQREDMMRNGYRTEYLFTTSSGAFYDRRNIAHMCDRYYKRIGIPQKKLHTYRHTFGTDLCKKGVALQTASALLGHGDINTTAKYYVAIEQVEKQKAVETLSEKSMRP